MEQEVTLTSEILIFFFFHRTSTMRASVDSWTRSWTSKLPTNCQGLNSFASSSLIIPNSQIVTQHFHHDPPRIGTDLMIEDPQNLSGYYFKIFEGWSGDVSDIFRPRRVLVQNRPHLQPSPRRDVIDRYIAKTWWRVL